MSGPLEVPSGGISGSGGSSGLFDESISPHPTYTQVSLLKPAGDLCGEKSYQELISDSLRSEFQRHLISKNTEFFTFPDELLRPG